MKGAKRREGGREGGKEEGRERGREGEKERGRSAVSPPAVCIIYAPYD